MKRKYCSCEICRLSRIIQRIAKKCTPAEKVVLVIIWERMEGAETDRDWQFADAQEGKKLNVAGRMYVPERKGNDRRLRLSKISGG